MDILAGGSGRASGFPGAVALSQPEATSVHGRLARIERRFGGWTGRTFATGALDIMHHLFGGLCVGKTTFPTRSRQAVAL